MANIIEDPLHTSGTFALSEIFHSIQGEGFNAGRPTTFVRFAGCNRSCAFCDTDNTPRMFLTAEQIAQIVGRIPPGWICFTGGEPCMQLTTDLLTTIYDACDPVEGGNLRWAVETNGTHWNATLAQMQHISISPKGYQIHGTLFHMLTHPGETWLPAIDSEAHQKFKGTVEFRWLISAEGHVLPDYAPAKAMPTLLSQLEKYSSIPDVKFFVSPVFTGNGLNLKALHHCRQYLGTMPRHFNLRLSLQTHKLIGVR